MRERSELFDELYDRLRKIARGRLAHERRGADNGNATSLVHEVYLKLRYWSNAFQDDKHFLATASAAMRQILTDQARARNAAKRAANSGPLSISIDGTVTGTQTPIDLLLFDETLTRLETFDKRAARVVEMRVFLGLNEEEIAADIGISPRTVKRDWAAASAWLKTEIGILDTMDGRG